MKISTFTGIVIGGLLLYYVLKKAGSLNQIKFIPGQVERIDLSGGNPELTFSIIATNPTDQSYTINSATGNLFVVNEGMDQFIGSVNNFEDQQINSRGQSKILLDIGLDAVSVVQRIIQAFQYGNFSMQMKFDGYVTVNSVTIPITQSFQV